jgi:hypothetical protein
MKEEVNNFISFIMYALIFVITILFQLFYWL